MVEAMLSLFSQNFAKIRFTDKEEEETNGMEVLLATGQVVECLGNGIWGVQKNQLTRLAEQGILYAEVD